MALSPYLFQAHLQFRENLFRRGCIGNKEKDLCPPLCLDNVLKGFGEEIGQSVNRQAASGAFALDQFTDGFDFEDVQAHSRFPGASFEQLRDVSHVPLRQGSL